jgi:Flp pilus assembly protein TadG
MTGAFGGGFAAYAAIDPVFSGRVYHLFSRDGRNGPRNPTSVTVMLDVSIASHVRAAAKRFAGANQGNIAVLFAVALVPILTFMGAAIDYSRANSARSSMQSALDSTALMLSKDLSDGRISPSDVEAKAKSYFAALYTNKDSTVVSDNIHATYAPKDSTTGLSNILITGSGYVTSNFMKIAGYPQLNFNTGATATWGNARMRVAMALDVTGSMSSDEKMTNLKIAATNMVNTLSALNKQTGDVYISIIPFSRDVNIGSTSPAAGWVTGWPAWESEPASIKTTKPANWKNYGPGSACPFGNQSFTCVTTPVSGSPNSEDAGENPVVPSNGTYKGYICPGVDNSTIGRSNYYNGCYNSVWKNTTTTRTDFCTGNNCACKFSKGMIGGEGSSCSCTGNNSQKKCTETVRDYDHTWIVNNHSTWNGCVTDRTENYDTLNDPPTLGDPAKLFFVEQYSACPAALVPMTNVWTTLTDKITALAPAGNTNQAIGAAWGWFSLTQAAPLSAPAKDLGYTYNDYVVLVSDGANTQNRLYGTAGAINDRQKILCDNMKAPPYNVTVFAVQINTGDHPDPTSPVLTYCASGAENFQEIKSAADTADAFKNITTQLAKLRVTR